MSGDVQLEVRQHGRHLRIRHPLLVHMLGCGHIAAKLRVVWYERRSLVGRQTRRATRTIAQLRRSMLVAHGDVLAARSQDAASHRRRLRSPHGYQRPI